MKHGATPHLALTFLKIGRLVSAGHSAHCDYAEGSGRTAQLDDSGGVHGKCWHWNITPGPIFFAAAVFIGYRLRRLPGASVCVLCTLLPSFVLVVAISALYVGVEANPVVMAAMHGITAGVIGISASVVLKTGRSAIKGLRSVPVVVITFVALAFFKMDPVVLIVAAGLMGAWLLQPTPELQKTET